MILKNVHNELCCMYYNFCESYCYPLDFCVENKILDKIVNI